MTPKTIKVRRMIGMEEEAEFLTSIDMSEDEILAYLEKSGEYLTWQETEVITHYSIVENYA